MENERKMISIDEMHDKIDEYGHKAIWLNIEKLGNWQERTAFRQVFFMAGGELGE